MNFILSYKGIRLVKIFGYIFCFTITLTYSMELFRQRKSQKPLVRSVAFIYRDEIYDKESRFKGQAEVITAKQRNGPTGVDVLSFGGETLLFGNIDLHREEY